jgi:hypothetical protein
MEEKLDNCQIFKKKKATFTCVDCKRRIGKGYFNTRT